MNTSRYVKTCVVILMGLASIPQIGWATGNIPPSKALIIFTRESWGCLTGQEVKEDVSIKIAKDDGNYATIQEIKNPEDVNNRYELYLIFPTKPVNQLTGNFVVKFWCTNDQPETKAYFSMEQASLCQKDKQWILSTKVKGNGFIHVQMLYSRTPEMRKAWFSCPEANIYQPYQLTFFSAYPLEGEFGGVPQQRLKEKWQTLDLTFNPLFLEGAVPVDKCQVFLDILDRQFAVSGSPLVWERNKVQTETIRLLATRGEEKIFHVLLKIDDGITIHVGLDNFVPHLRQKLALKNPDGKLVGAELWLRAIL